MLEFQREVPDPAKVAAIKELPPPTCVKQVETFLGKVGYYGRFIPNYAHVARPLNQLKHKDHEWEWTPECEKAFEQLKGLSM